MKQIFLCVLSLSLSGALTGLLILLMRPVTRRFFSKRWNYYIWLLLIARLMVPVSVEMDQFHFVLSDVVDVAQEQQTALESEWSEQQKEAGNVEHMAEADAVKEQKVEDFVKAFATGLEVKSLQGAESPKTISFAMEFMPMEEVLWIVWISAAIIIFFIKVRNYRKFTNRIRTECDPVSDSRVYEEIEKLCERLQMRKQPQIFESKAVFGPITIGLLKPVIVLPKEERDFMQLPLILHHELLHVKRKDLWYKWIYQILLCVHWFNPVLYLAGRKLNSDCELSCDESVLIHLTQEGKKAYGNLLLDVASWGIDRNRKVPVATLLERKQDLKERLRGILQYKKKCGFKGFLSLLLAVGMLGLSACGSIQVSPDSMPVHLTGEDREREEDSFWDQMASWVDSGLDSFLAQSVQVDKEGEAWQAYDQDEIIAGEDVSDQWHMYSYMGGNRIKCSGMFLNGTASVLIVHASGEAELQVNSEFQLLSGRFELVHVAPDGAVTTVNDSGEKETVGITLEEGRNVIKFVGQEAKVRGLQVKFDFREKDFETVFYSENEERAEEVKAKIQAGSDVEKDEVLETITYLDDEIVSRALALLLSQGEELKDDELLDLIIYSDSELSGKYLVEAVKNGEADALDEQTIYNIKYYLEEEELVELILALGDDLTFDLIYDCAPYLSSDGLAKCVEKYRESGRQLTGLQFDKLAVYMDEDVLEKLML